MATQTFKSMITERTVYKRPAGIPNNLQDWAKQVWMLPDLEDKKAIALDMIDNFAFKAKADKFRALVNKAKTGTSIDKLVGDIVLSGDGMGVK